MKSSRFQKGRTQAALSIVDQVLSSLTNLLLGILAARALGVVEFGGFSSVFILYTILVGGVAATVGQVVVLGDYGDRELVERAREGIAFSLILGVSCAAVIAGAAAGLDSVRGPLLALAVFLPLLLAQDSLRYGAAALQRMEISVLSDGLWLVLLIATFGIFFVLDVSISPASAIFAWGAAGAVSGLVCYPILWSFTSRLDLSGFRRRDFLGYRFIGEYVAVRAASQGFILLLGALAGLAATGSVRGIATLYGPLAVAMAAAASFGAPLVRRVPPHRRDLFLVLLTTLLVGVCAAFSVALGLTPTAAGEAVLGDSWSGAMDFLPAMATQVMFAAVTTTSYLGLRLVAPRSTLPIRLWTAAVVPPAFFVGYATGGAVGALWGLTCASAVQAAVGSVRYLQLRARGTGLAHLDH